MTLTEAIDFSEEKLNSLKKCLVFYLLSDLQFCLDEKANFLTFNFKVRKTLQIFEKQNRKKVLIKERGKTKPQLTLQLCKYVINVIM